jgi:hypothetical protein
MVRDPVSLRERLTGSGLDIQVKVASRPVFVRGGSYE